MFLSQPSRHYPLLFVQLRLDGWRHREPGIRDADAIRLLALAACRT
jgi:hypothetical protein